MGSAKLTFPDPESAAFQYRPKDKDHTLNLAPNLIDVNPRLRLINNDTLGLRFDEAYNLPMMVPLRAVYRAEYVYQQAKVYDKPNAENSYDADYKIAELGIVWDLGEAEYA